MSPRRSRSTAGWALALSLACGAGAARAQPVHEQRHDHDNAVRAEDESGSFSRSDALESGLAGLVAMAFSAVIAIRALRRGNEPPPPL